MKLLPKTNNFTQMVSAFISRDFGVGIILNEDKMRAVNLHRARCEWGKYVSSDGAFKINGTN